MTKKELAEMIATNLFPTRYASGSPAVQEEIKSLLKKNKTELEAIAQFGRLI